MSRKIFILILFVAAGISVIAQETTPSFAEAAEGKPAVSTAPVDPVAAALGAMGAGQFQTAEMHLVAIPDLAAQLFVKACIERAKGESKNAIQTLAALIVQYPNDPQWTAKSELMCAVLYMDLGLLDAADVTARQVQVLHEDPAVATKADALRAKIAKIKEEMEVK